MNKIIFCFIFLSFSISASTNQEMEFFDDLCPDHDRNYTCNVRFETIYSYRNLLIGTNVRIEGILIIESNPPHEEEKLPLMLLFPSTERARIFNVRFAIELTPSPLEHAANIDKDIARPSFRFTSVSGKFYPDPKERYWGRIEVMKGIP